LRDYARPKNLKLKRGPRYGRGSWEGAANSTFNGLSLLSVLKIIISI